MIKAIVKDREFLSQKSTTATKEDLAIVQDLIDTANEHKERCLGLASIQIGYPKRIIVIRKGDGFIPLINPVITRKSPEKYVAEERCLSFDEPSTVTRHKQIQVIYSDTNFKSKSLVLTGLPAQIVQHEVDHCNGICI